jgi:hypothetical protein
LTIRYRDALRNEFGISLLSEKIIDYGSTSARNSIPHPFQPFHIRHININHPENEI